MYKHPVLLNLRKTTLPVVQRSEVPDFLLFPRHLTARHHRHRILQERRRKGLDQVNQWKIRRTRRAIFNHKRR
jgi:hypothetical protein